METNGHRQLRIAGISATIGRRGLKPPELSTFRVPVLSSGSSDLGLDEEVLVQLLDADGRPVVSSYGTVGHVGLRRHRPRAGRPWLERVHAIELQ